MLTSKQVFNAKKVIKVLSAKYCAMLKGEIGISRIIQTNNAPAAIGPYSQAVAVGNLIFTSGQISLDPETGLMVGKDIAVQTHRVCKNLEAVLSAAGSSLKSAVKTVCFLSDMSDFALFNEVYAQYFTEKPARSCVAARELPKGALVEIEVIAEKEQSQ